MFIHESSQKEIHEVVSQIDDYIFVGDITNPNGRNFTIRRQDRTKVGLLSIVNYDDFAELGVVIHKDFRGKWLTKNLLRQIYNKSFKDNDTLIVRSSSPVVGRIMAKEGWLPYHQEGEITSFVMYKHKLRKEWK